MRPIERCWTFLLVLFAFLNLPAWGRDTFPASSQIPAIHSTEQQLRHIKLPANSARWDEVPEDARPLLTDVKHQLRDLISNTLASPGGRNSDPRPLAGVILNELRKNQISIKPQNCHQAYGCILGINFQQFPDRPQLLLASTVLSMYCAHDVSLYVFERAGRSYVLRLALESNGYAQVSGAQNQLQYAFLTPAGAAAPAEANSDWVLATTQVQAVCTSPSLWRTIRLRVLRPTADPDQPQQLLNQDDYADLSQEGNYKWWVDGDTVTLRYQGNMILDGALGDRIHLAKFQVTENGARRVSPIALLPQDFVDEWIQLPWSEAAKWTKSPDAQRLEQWHFRIRSAKALSEFSKFDFVQPCSAGDDRWQVGLAISLLGSSEALSNDVYVSVSKANDSFFVSNVSFTRPPGCPGQTPPSESDASLKETN